MKHIKDYYSPNQLYSRILSGLDKAGADLDDISVDDLQPVDEFHIRGGQATKELVKLSGFNADMHILDMGCGIGGSARRLSHETGCCVTGVDLSEEYIDAARELTKLVNMEERVSFQAANILSLPFADETFDGAWSIQMGMNIEHKREWLSEVFRVLKPGASVIFYEVFANDQSPLHFPVPWAQSSDMSFLIKPDNFKTLLIETGFDVRVWNDKTELAKQVFEQIPEPGEHTKLPAIGVHMLVGEDVPLKAYNLRRNLEQQRVSLIETLVTKK